MYRDPKLIKKHIVKVRFDDEENQLLEALSDFTGDQKAVLVRELISIGLKKFHEQNFKDSDSVDEGQFTLFQRAA